LQAQVGDAYLYAAVDSAQVIEPGLKSLTEWTKKFCQAFEENENIRKYLANRKQHGPLPM